MDIEHVIGQYTGEPVTWDDLAATARATDPALRAISRAVHHAAAAVHEADTELAGLATTLIHRVTTVQHNLVSGNTGAGMSIASSNGSYRDNTIQYNSAPGILLSGSGNQFIGNDIADEPPGFRLACIEFLAKQDHLARPQADEARQDLGDTASDEHTEGYFREEEARA